ncbi:S8 family serine peptidase [Cytobacillus oceanisediminis]|uniref:S8 family serine peptidase n=1 Tax=Cytobacillus oceanisediminis TaxID=665099 RepID=UPI0037362C03
MEFHSLFKKTAVMALSVSLLMSPVHSVLSTDAAAAEYKAEDILASLTAEQRQALHQLQLNNPTGLQGFTEEDLQSKGEISVIVQFKSKPSKVAVLEAAVKGKALKKEEAAAQVEKEHKKFKEDIKKYLPQENSKTKSISNAITQTYKRAYNGVAMKLPADQVRHLLESNVVQAVFKSQTFTVDPIQKKLPSDVEREVTTSVESIPYLKIDKLHKEGITGEGVKVAVLDTGIDYNHPDLRDAYKGGYDFVDNDNDPMEATYEDWKKTNNPEFSPYGSAYYTSHGTHVSGTIAGQNKNDSEVSVAGVAPDAELYVYRVLGPYGTGTSEGVIAGIEKAVEDGMDVMNLSLGATVNDPYYPTSTAINYAVLNGVTAVVSAGNSGPNANTVGSPGTAALALTVGASDVPVELTTFTGSISGNWSTELVSMGRSFADDFSSLDGKSLELVDVGLGAQENYAEKDVEGKIAFVQRGNFALNDKIRFAKERGAKAVILYNNVDGQLGINLGESPLFVPAFSMTKAAGEELKEKIAQGNTTFTFSNMEEMESEGDRLADFSSRGPVKNNYDIKPEVVAPGVSVLSTFPSYMIDPENQEDYKYAYARLSGTSMAAPHTAGIAALLLEENPELDPDDIKTILMNTADPMNGEYSLYEVGAGRVDPYQAIHGEMKMQATDETLIPDGEEYMSVKNPSGDISFGIHFGEEGTNIQVKENISFTNNSDITKEFTVSVEENPVERTNSLSENGVAVNTNKSVKVKAGDEVKTNVFLKAPKSAKAGLYEAFIVLTNTADSTDRYRIPFNFRVTKDGLGHLDLLTPSITPPYLNQGRTHIDNRLGALVTFSLSSPGEKMDVVLQDGKTGEDLGLIGTLNLTNSPLDTTLFLFAFRGMYYSFTGDSKQPIAEEVSYAKPGHYKLNFITTSQSGKVTNEMRNLFIDIDDPAFTSSLDGQSPFLEYKPGQETYPFDIQINDTLVEEMQSAGVDIDQSSNSVIYTWGEWGFPSSPIPMDKDGKWVEEIAMEKSMPALKFTMTALDSAGNSPLTKEYFFVKEGTPVTYAKSDTKKAKTGETIKAKLFLDNVSDAEEVIWNMKEQYGKTMQFIDAKLTDGVSDKGTVTVNGDEVKVVFNDSNMAFNHTAVVDVTLKITDETFLTGTRINPTATVVNSQNQSSKLLNAGYTFEVSPQYNAAYGYVLPDGFINPANGLHDRKDWTKVGASLKFKEASGFVLDATSLIKERADYRVEKLPLSKDPYILEIKVPGHFEVNSKQNIGFEYKGELYGMNHYVNPIHITAGDVNQDNVIDVLDAIEIQNAWETNSRAADINFDGTVDEKDIVFVRENYLLQNESVENPPAAKEIHDGKTLESILAELGIQ